MPPPRAELLWRHTQAFGDDNSSSDDLVTTVSFDCTGNYLAVGDNAGRICVFEAKDDNATATEVAARLGPHARRLARAAARKAADPEGNGAGGDHLFGPDGEDEEEDDAYAALFCLQRGALGEWVPRDDWQEFAIEAGNSTSTSNSSESGSSSSSGSSSISASTTVAASSPAYLTQRAPRRVAPLIGGPSTNMSSLSASTVGSGGGVGVGGSGGPVSALLDGRICPQRLEYRFYSEFQSHEPEFDALKSSEIEERINALAWVQSAGSGYVHAGAAGGGSGSPWSTSHYYGAGASVAGAGLVLSTNDKTIKLWRVRDKTTTTTTAGGVQTTTTTPTATLKRSFPNAHAYHIHSLSASSDGVSFLSADDVRVHVWHLAHGQECFNVLDIKPPALEELAEVITSAHYHPVEPSLFLFGSSRGAVRIADLRDAALGDHHHARAFDCDEDPSAKSFFSEITGAISDARFSPDGRHVIARDYLSLKIWDVRVERAPVATVPVHDYLRMHLCDLYENDCVFDRFSLALSCDGTQVATGSYNNSFVVHDIAHNTTTTVDAQSGGAGGNGARKRGGGKGAKSLRKGVTASAGAAGGANKTMPVPGASPGGGAGAGAGVPDVNALDFGKKALHLAWHPRMAAVAVAGLNKLYVYQAHAAYD